MNRRRFLSLGGGMAAVAAGLEPRRSDGAPPRSATKPAPEGGVRMHVGTQRSGTTAEMLQYVKRHGVDHICGYPPDPGERGYWTVDDVEKTRELCEKHGVTLSMVALPF
ncbi:MAG: hypothetical protein ACRD2X_04955, partial [Vicinamibacteraceae bacterium]